MSPAGACSSSRGVAVEPITLPTGEQRGFLADGDEITFRGYCERAGFVSIGLGECSGTITENTHPD